MRCDGIYLNFIETFANRIAALYLKKQVCNSLSCYIYFNRYLLVIVNTYVRLKALFINKVFRLADFVLTTFFVLKQLLQNEQKVDVGFLPCF